MLFIDRVVAIRSDCCDAVALRCVKKCDFCCITVMAHYMATEIAPAGANKFLTNWFWPTKYFKHSPTLCSETGLGTGVIYMLACSWYWSKWSGKIRIMSHSSSLISAVSHYHDGDEDETISR